MSLLSRFVMVFKARASSALDRAEDPREVMAYAYEQQKDLLVRTKRGLVDVATAKVRLQQQARKLRGQVPKVEQQARHALDLGREDLARAALERKQTILPELERLDLQVAEVAGDAERLTRTEQQLATRVEEFRTRRDSVSARYTAAQAQVRISETLTGVSGEFADLSMAVGRAMEKTESMQARAEAVGSLLDSGALELPEHAVDAVERELTQVAVERAVEDDLAALKAALMEGREPPALGSGG